MSATPFMVQSSYEDELTPLMQSFDLNFDFEAEHYVPALTLEIEDERGDISPFVSFRAPLWEGEVGLYEVGVSVSEASSDFLLDPTLAQHNLGIESDNAEISPFNTNPNIAITLPSNLFGLDLHDLANHQERWYNFHVPANRKVAVMLSYMSGIYDLYLFRLNGSSLQLVDFSMMGTGTERISYISPVGGTYFLAVAPFIPAPTPHMFTFVVDVISHFDAHETDDFRSLATNWTNTINTQGNIDNRFDEDWHRLTVTTPNTKNITVSNAPTGNHYAVFLYNSNLNTVGSFFANGSATRQVDLGIGHYYIRIVSLTGHHVAANYNLIVETRVPQRPITQSNSFSRLQFSPLGRYSLFSGQFQAGGQLVLDLNATMDSWVTWERLIAMVETRTNSSHPWQLATEFWVTPNSANTSRLTFDFPYRQIHIPGQPLFSDGDVRVWIIVDSFMPMEISASFTILGRYQ